MTGKLDKSSWEPMDHALYELNAMVESFGTYYGVTAEFIDRVLRPLAQSFVDQGRRVEVNEENRRDVQARLYDAYIATHPIENVAAKDPRHLWNEANLDQKQLITFEYFLTLVNIRTKREYELPILNSAIMACAEIYVNSTLSYPVGNVHRVGLNKIVRIKCKEIIEKLEAYREQTVDSQTEPQLAEIGEHEEIGQPEQLIA